VRLGAVDPARSIPTKASRRQKPVVEVAKTSDGR
jgi:hypothetical protein